jgi:hypothetical protein
MWGEDHKSYFRNEPPILNFILEAIVTLTYLISKDGIFVLF